MTKSGAVMTESDAVVAGSGLVMAKSGLASFFCDWPQKLSKLKGRAVVSCGDASVCVRVIEGKQQELNDAV